jgi:hypothetical protein
MLNDLRRDYTGILHHLTKFKWKFEIIFILFDKIFRWRIDFNLIWNKKKYVCPPPPPQQQQQQQLELL